MINIGLLSQDRTLFALLSSALGKDFQFKLEPDEQGMDALVSTGECDVMIVDLNSSSSSSLERIVAARRLIGLPVPAIIMGDEGFRSTAFELVRAGAFGFCSRPPSVRDLKTMLSRAYETSTLRQQLRAAQGHLEEPVACDKLTGSSPQMQRVYQLVRCVTNINVAVLVTGESGTGKELIARAIHNIGARSERPFVAVSCGAIPETLIEAELFGHEKGAFTGAVGMREGYFEKAQDGTLFLDEIGELSLPTQAKLLRVLQQKEFNRLGSSRLIPLRARLIFATNRDLPKMIAEGNFRQDLFYRINVMQIMAPALREHIEDVPVITRHFLKHYCQEFGKPTMDIEPDALALLQSYSWAGNVRELENVVQRAIILAPGQIVRTEDLTLSNREEDKGGALDVADIVDYRPAGTFEDQLRDYKIKVAVSAIRAHNGNKTLAARTLCISRPYLHRLLHLDEVDVSEELQACAQSR